jgi:N,N'-diacetyllegionaminate synthase
LSTDKRIAPVMIGSTPVGPGARCFVIAEAGVNHNGSVEMALRLIDAAAEAGADAVKFQTFAAGRLTTASAPTAAYQRQTGATSQIDLLKALELSEDAHTKIQRRCTERGVIFLSTPFDELSADLLDRLGVPAFKIGSGEITNLPLLQHVAAKRRPVLLSTGMSTLMEVGTAVQTLRAGGATEIILLQCTSSYPAPAASANLNAMRTLEREFGVPVGYSDHTQGIHIALAAVALGACVVEKHLTLDRQLPGPDHQASIEPREFAELVNGIHEVEAALGSGVKEPTSAEVDMAAIVRRSVVAARDLRAGEILTRDGFVLKRPGTGIPPSSAPDLIGRRLRVDVRADAALRLDMFEKSGS